MKKNSSTPYFTFQQFTIHHDQCAMKVGTDGVLLGAWTNVSNAKIALDIGTGTGLIALMLAQRNAKLRVDALEIEQGAARQAQKNSFESPFAERVAVKNVRLQDYDTIEKYDCIVSNPPYFIRSLKSDSTQRTLARHTDSLSAECLISHSCRLLADRGKISVIYPFEYREELATLAEEYNLYITRVTNVYPTPQAEPKRILMELSKEKKMLEERDLIIEIDRHVYSDEFRKLTDKFYLKK